MQGKQSYDIKTRSTTMARGTYKKSGESALRARYHDFNSQRRFRNQTTIGWESYKKQTQQGRKRYTKAKR